MLPTCSTKNFKDVIPRSDPWGPGWTLEVRSVYLWYSVRRGGTPGVETCHYLCSGVISVNHTIRGRPLNMPV
jgi:hypothetical protein